MAKLIVLGVLAIIEVVSELWDCWRTASTARERRTGAAIPMHDETPGVPTEAAPSESGANRPLRR